MAETGPLAHLSPSPDSSTVLNQVTRLIFTPTSTTTLFQVLQFGLASLVVAVPADQPQLLQPALLNQQPRPPLRLLLLLPLLRRLCTRPLPRRHIQLPRHRAVLAKLDLRKSSMVSVAERAGPGLLLARLPTPAHTPTSTTPSACQHRFWMRR